MRERGEREIIRETGGRCFESMTGNWSSPLK